MTAIWLLCLAGYHPQFISIHKRAATLNGMKANCAFAHRASMNLALTLAHVTAALTLLQA